MRSNPCAPARRSSLPSRECRSADGARGRRRVAGPGAPGGGPGRSRSGGMFAGTGAPIPPQDVAEVSTNWPAGNIDVRMANYLCQAQQKWTIAAVPNAGGYPGSPYFKITIAGTDRTLAATADAELVVLPAFTGGPEQLWRIDQLADGAWRIMPKVVPNSKNRWRSRRSAAVSRRSRSSIPRATNSAGCSRHHDRLQNSRKTTHGRFWRCAAGRSPLRFPPPTLTQPRIARESARRRRLHPALAAAGADRRQRAHRQRRAGGGEEGIFPRPVHGRSARRRQGDRRRHATHLARRGHRELQRQPLSLRPRAGQADVRRSVLGRHRRQLPRRKCATCAWPSAPTRLRSGG